MTNFSSSTAAGGYGQARQPLRWAEQSLAGRAEGGENLIHPGTDECGGPPWASEQKLSRRKLVLECASHQQCVVRVVLHGSLGADAGVGDHDVEPLVAGDHLRDRGLDGPTVCNIARDVTDSRFGGVGGRSQIDLPDGPRTVRDSPETML